MKSRIVWGVLITAAAALLVAGAVNRTLARTESGQGGGEQASQQQRRGQAANEQAAVLQDGSGVTESQGAGYGGNGGGQGRGRLDATGESYAVQGAGSQQGQGTGRGQGAEGGLTAEPLAEIEDLETLQGTVLDVNEELLLLAQGDSEPLEIGGRAWRFALENGFSVGQDDTITVVGFYDEDHFEPIAITNEGSGQQMQLREASGRPLWAGRGQRNAGT